MKATPIPQRSRDLVRARDRDRCVRCAVPTHNGHWHHRRTRHVRDAHQHCACNGVWLCPTCHSWVHHNPTKAGEAGLIVSRAVDLPGSVPYKTPYGWVSPHCDGTWIEAL